MSHHADYPLDPRLDITDVYCFTGTMGTAFRPSTVFVMNVDPLQVADGTLTGTTSSGWRCRERRTS